MSGEWPPYNYSVTCCDIRTFAIHFSPVVFASVVSLVYNITHYSKENLYITGNGYVPVIHNSVTEKLTTQNSQPVLTYCFNKNLNSKILKCSARTTCTF